MIMILKKLLLSNRRLTILLLVFLFISFSFFFLKNGSDAPNTAFRLNDKSILGSNLLHLKKSILKVRKDVTELSSYLIDDFKKLTNEKNSSVIINIINKMVISANERKNEVLNTVDDIMESITDNRLIRLRNLGQLVQFKLHKQQHPQNCATVKKLVCDFYHKCGCCGFGCILHHFAYCLMMAYGTNRTLVLEYSGSAIRDKWDLWFDPISSCTLHSTVYRNWDENKDSDQPIIKLPRRLDLINKPDFLAVVPTDLDNNLLFSSFTDNGYAWWTGQLLKYILRPRIELKNAIEEMKERIGFQHPIVGVHIRRTDKVYLNEAYAFPLDEYMKRVDKYYETLNMQEIVERRRIYLATDEAEIFSEAHKKYPQYLILGDTRLSELAALQSRTLNESLLGILLDFHFLAQCDHIVCTMSSNVCRAVYEYRHTINPHVTYHSLDWTYSFW